MADTKKTNVKPEAKGKNKANSANGNKMDISSYVEDSRYTEFLDAYQRGDWEQSGKTLDILLEAYPIETELRQLKNDHEMRSQVDGNEVVETKIDQGIKIRNIVMYLVGGGVALVLLIIGFNQSSDWLDEQRIIAARELEQASQRLTLDTRFLDSQALMQGGLYVDAFRLLEEIQKIDSDYPNLESAIEEAKEFIGVDAKYMEAMEFKDEGNGILALEILREMVTEYPFFKDIDLQINGLEREYELGEILADAENAYVDEEWIIAIENFEKALNIDPDLDEFGVEDKLFDSYIRGAEFLLVGEDITLNELELAEGYFRKSLSLRPQDKEALGRRAEINDSIAGLLARGYIRAAQSILADQADSLDALNNASVYFGKALSLNPEVAEIQLQYTLARNYIKAASNFRNGLWSGAINDLNFIYGVDTGYADGTAEQMLYEAHVARGNTFLIIGNFSAALQDFDQAVLIAQADPDIALRLFEAQISVAYTLGRQGKHRDAVNLYESAIDETGIRAQAEENDPDLANALKQGEIASARRDYRSAFIWYNDALRGNTQVYLTFRYTVVQGDYLAKIARRFNSTVQAIMEANNLSTYYLAPGQILLIPTLK